AFAVNVTAPAALTRLLTPQLTAAGATVVMINSGAGSHPIAHMPIYVATKYALNGLAASLRLDLGPAGVRVVTIAPGPTLTRMQQRVVAGTGANFTPERYLRAEDVAQAVWDALKQPGDVEYLSLRPPTPGPSQS